MAVVLNKGIFIVSAKRTPFGKMRGSLRDVPAADLLAAAARAALRAACVPPRAVGSANVGQVYSISAAANAGITNKLACLKAGLPARVPALTVNSLCGSGFQAVINSAQDILTGVAEVSLAGGTENMAMAPFVVRDVRFGTELGRAMSFEDILVSGAFDTYCGLTMAQTAENLAQKTWTTFDLGAFEEEMAPVTVQAGDGSKVRVARDEHPRPATTMAVLRDMPPAFRAGGLGTVGNSTGACHGAGAIILASEEAVQEHDLQPLVRVVGWSRSGVEPALMGLGPVPAVRHLLAAADCSLQDIDMVEINEPFAGQALASALQLGVDMERLNVNGGAIALGHPPAASGARITAHLTHQLRRRGRGRGRGRGQRGIGAACIGGGQGVALLLEAVP